MKKNCMRLLLTSVAKEAKKKGSVSITAEIFMMLSILIFIFFFRTTNPLIKWKNRPINYKEPIEPKKRAKREKKKITSFK